MVIWRGYKRAGDPDKRPTFLDVPENRDAHSSELKGLCALDCYDRLPSTPTVCPACHIPACFSMQLCVDAGYAGAFAFTCQRSVCNRTHVPEQWGPTEQLLEKIEHQRALERANAATQASSETKKPTPDHSAPASTAHVEDVGPDIKRTTAKNKVKLENARASRKVHEHKGKVGVKVPRKAKRGSRVFGMIGNALHIEERRMSAGSRRRRRDELPVKREVLVENGNCIYLGSYHWVRDACAPGTPLVFEYWMWDVGHWTDAPFLTSKIGVDEMEDTLFVRLQDLPCTGFGHELRLAQDAQFTSAAATHPSAGLTHCPADIVYFAVWEQNWQEPTIYKQPRVGAGELVGTAWRGPKGLLQDGIQPGYWLEAESRWESFEDNRRIRGSVPPNASVILLRRANVIGLLGLGDVLAFAENDRAIREALGGDYASAGANAILFGGRRRNAIGSAVAPSATHTPARLALAPAVTRISFLHLVLSLPPLPFTLTSRPSFHAFSCLLGFNNAATKDSVLVRAGNNGHGDR
ncbi:hypothetical protein FKP32DRAFT_1672468 [Trametes sanguinea]|nr:hypothetical protein FKP32DRAFT_1672468 [Trametes sanguinea]